MPKRDAYPGDLDDTCRRADDKVRGKNGQPPDSPEAPNGVVRLVHELRAQQVELEMQNEELRKARRALEEMRDRYAGLYDSIPVGCFTLTCEERIKEVNLTGASLLGSKRQDLVNAGFRRFVAQEDMSTWDRYLARLSGADGKQRCDLKLKRIDGLLFNARLESMRLDSAGEAVAFRIAVSDL